MSKIVLPLSLALALSGATLGCQKAEEAAKESEEAAEVSEEHAEAAEEAAEDSEAAEEGEEAAPEEGSGDATADKESESDSK